MPNRLEPGAYVKLPAAADWGIGQVQAVVGSRVTVNFEHAGKRLIDVARAELVPASPDETSEQPAS